MYCKSSDCSWSTTHPKLIGYLRGRRQNVQVERDTVVVCATYARCKAVGGWFSLALQAERAPSKRVDEPFCKALATLEMTTWQRNPSRDVEEELVAHNYSAQGARRNVTTESDICSSWPVQGFEQRLHTTLQWIRQKERGIHHFHPRRRTSFHYIAMKRHTADVLFIRRQCPVSRGEGAHDDIASFGEQRIAIVPLACVLECTCPFERPDEEEANLSVAYTDVAVDVQMPSLAWTAQVCRTTLSDATKRLLFRRFCMCAHSS